MIETGMRWSAVDFVNAANVRRTLSDTLRPFFDRYDLLLTPTLPAPPLPVGVNYYEEIGGKNVSSADNYALTYPMNLTGFPSASVPCGGLTMLEPFPRRGDGTKMANSPPAKH